MQQEKDYLKREINKIIKFLKRLIEKVSKESVTEDELKVSKEFTAIFNFEIIDLVKLDNKKFIENTKHLHTEILETTAFLFAELAKKATTKNKILYAEKAVILLNLIDDRERIFSIERTQLKAQLTKIVPRET